MKKKVLVRIYHLSDAALKQEASLVNRNILRDQSDFAKRNISHADIAEHLALINNFDISTTDEEYRGYLSVAVIAKNNVADKVRGAIRNIRNMAELEYDSMGKYLVFGFDDMNNLSDADLYKMSRRVNRVGSSLLGELAKRGLTDELLNELFTLGSDLDTAIADVGSANERRDLETQARIMAGNALFKATMALCSIGQTIYFEKDEARYNDYIIYDSEGKVATLPDPEPPANNG